MKSAKHLLRLLSKHQQKLRKRIRLQIPLATRPSSLATRQSRDQALARVGGGGLEGQANLRRKTAKHLPSSKGLTVRASNCSSLPTLRRGITSQTHSGYEGCRFLRFRRYTRHLVSRTPAAFVQHPHQAVCL